jgi:sulfate/thiosulfate transport system substrate-binding protein
MHRRSLVALLVLAALAAVPAAFAGHVKKSDTSLSVVGYSIPTVVFPKLFAAYQATPQGQGIKFTSSFAASDVQSKAVAAGLPADVVNLSATPDVDRLVQAGLVDKNWDNNAYHGIVSKSVVVFILRDGNPKHIKTWSDLVKPGVQVVFPNPFSSTGARWDIMAAYGAQLRAGKTPKQAQAYLAQLFHNNVSQDTSARNALNTFLSGRGDVLLDYESDAIAAEKAGDAVQYIIPKQTILIETPIAVTAKSSHAQQAQAFVNWQWTTAGQTIWAQQGYRPVLASVAKQYASKFPTPPQLFTISYLGGWTSVKKSFFDPSSGSVTKIEQAAGVPTASS